MTSRSAQRFLLLLASSAWPTLARAQGEAETAPRWSSPERSAGTGAFLPFTNLATVDGQRATGSAFGGYDTARNTGFFEAAAEVQIWKGLSLRGGALYTASTDRLRPSFGARYQFLSESRHGLDGGVGVFYRPEGLTEPEGEIEAMVSGGRHVGRAYVLGNLVYGQDAEANERDGEVRIAALQPVGTRLFLGLDGRLRFDLGSQPSKLEAKLDAVVGPVATVVAGPVAFTVQAGASALKIKDDTSYGAVVLGGLGSSF
jgi:hypothetical protein